jgi:hypothetical protein
MARKNLTSFVALWLIAAASITSTSAQDAGKNRPEREVIGLTLAVRTLAAEQT